MSHGLSKLKYKQVDFLSSTLSYQGPAKKAKPVKGGIRYLYYQLNDLNAEKIPAFTIGNV